MILYSDATTPFGRKALIAALERGIEVEERFVNLADPGKYLDINPLGQIPALVLSSGQAVFDSDVIVDCLDELHDGPRLVSDEDRSKCLSDIHLANGVMESVLLRVMETRRPDGERSPAFIDRLETRIKRALVRMERDRRPATDGPLDGEEIATACALEYVDFRFEHDWRGISPKLRAWHDAVSKRPTLIATKPTRTEPVSSPLA